MPVQPKTENEMNQATARDLFLPLCHGRCGQVSCPTVALVSFPVLLQHIQTMLIPRPEYGLRHPLGLSSVTVNFSRSTMES
jgi:hypothetical protein